MNTPGGGCKARRVKKSRPKADSGDEAHGVGAAVFGQSSTCPKDFHYFQHSGSQNTIDIAWLQCTLGRELGK